VRRPAHYSRLASQALISRGPCDASHHSVQVFAFTCGQNLFPCFNELRNNTQRRMNTVIGSSIGGATVIYEILALAGVRFLPPRRLAVCFSWQSLITLDPYST
jgi:hypothetical protein